MSAAQITVMICHSVQVISIRGHLCPGIVKGHRLPAIQLGSISAWWQRGRHIVCKIKRLHGVIHKGVDLVRKSPISLKPLKLNYQDWWQASK